MKLKKYLVIETSGTAIENIGVVSAGSGEDAVTGYVRDGDAGSALKAYKIESLEPDWKLFDDRLAELTAEAKKCWLKNHGNCAAVWTGYNGYRDSTSHTCHYCKKFAGQRTDMMPQKKSGDLSDSVTVQGLKETAQYS